MNYNNPTCIALDKAFAKLHKRKKCQICGKDARETHHIIPRANTLYRWDRRNALFLCKECHFGIHHCGAEKPLPMFEIEDYRSYKIRNCMSDEDFLKMKCKEYGVKLESIEFDSIKKKKVTNCNQLERAREYRHEQYLKAKELKKCSR